MSDLEQLAAVLTLRADAHHRVHEVNRELAKRDISDPAYVEGRAARDAILVALAQGKWALGTYDGTFLDLVKPDNSPANLKRAVGLFERVVEISNSLAAEVRAGKVSAAKGPDLERRSEILFADGVPLVPSICPVVVLKGSNFDMGRQYAQQVIDIYGSWIFAQLTREMTAAQHKEVTRWKAELARYNPDVLEFARGWAAGANQCGLTMSEDHAVALFTGTRQPADRPSPLGFGFTDDKDDDKTMAAYLGMVRQRDPVSEDICSGIAAWGGGTSDGKLVAGASTDHDVTYEATIVAFPDDGYPYVYTPFSANGSIPMLGQHFMAGHPGFNAKGMAYVHHAGANTGEPVEQWGYGVRRGPMIFSALQHAASARESCAQQMQYPVGDTAISVGSGNGLFADDHEGFAVECRAGAPDNVRPVVRTHSYDAYGDPYDFLYANNNAIDPRSGHANAPPPEGYGYSLAGGWYTLDPEALDERHGGAGMRRRMAKSSEARNRYAYRMMMEGYGRIDLDYMTMVYRQNGEVPEGDLAELTAQYEAGGRWNSSVAGRHNANVTIIKPSEPGGGIFRTCIGAANPGSEVKDPGHGYTLFDETYAFWELRLRETPEEVAATAGIQAEADITAARDMMDTLPARHAGRPLLANYVAIAEASTEQGHKRLKDALSKPAGDERLAELARAVRRFTTAQVRARQVTDAIQPPPVTSQEFAHWRGAPSGSRN